MSNVWRVVLDTDLRMCHNVIFTIKSDLVSNEQQKREFIQVSELKQIETLLQTLETTLNAFHQALPRLNPVEV